ncbi:hypothetical protein BS50DRAFT_644848 [Corynespora cassiicola Philippines]|uniref:Rhodopsin domain-containing protein n=1 Tax=Corynespora cassiicola Philippines TaxID=1448308 RepID=A0A2T2NHU5_CORCC|nr:hypothetical protein BS50DRAFT_644848 [Corynespora cassiicola Philippines]
MAVGIEFLIEVWVLYAIGVLWLLLRLAVRLRTVGILALQLDDAFTLLVLASWTVNCVGIHITYYTGSAIGFVPSEDSRTRAYQLARAEYGAKLYFTTWYTYIMQLWCLKGTVLVFYRRLAIDRWQEILLKITTWFCAATFIGLMCVLTFSCFPYHENWQVWPRPPSWCSAKPKLLIATSCFNAFTDIMLLTIPVPLLWKLTLPPIKKACLVILLSSGIFVLAACITRVTLSVDPNVSLATIARWGTRELTIGIVAVNTAMLRPGMSISMKWCKYSSDNISNSQIVLDQERPGRPPPAQLCFRLQKSSSRDIFTSARTR